MNTDFFVSLIFIFCCVLGLSRLQDCILVLEMTSLLKCRDLKCRVTKLFFGIQKISSKELLCFKKESCNRSFHSKLSIEIIMQRLDLLSTLCCTHTHVGITYRETRANVPTCTMSMHKQIPEMLFSKLKAQ